MTKLATLSLIALLAIGCASIPSELTMEQVQLLQKAADQNRAAKDNILSEYVQPAIDADNATLSAAYLRDVHAARVDANLSDAEFDSRVDALRKQKDAAIAEKTSARIAPLAALDVNADAMEGSIDKIKKIAAKVNN